MAVCLHLAWVRELADGTHRLGRVVGSEAFVCGVNRAAGHHLTARDFLEAEVVEALFGLSDRGGGSKGVGVEDRRRSPFVGWGDRGSEVSGAVVVGTFRRSEAARSRSL